MCVWQIRPHSLFLRWKKCKLSYCKIQVSSLRRFAFATLRWPHCVRPPTPLRQPGSATRLIAVLAPLPAHSGAQTRITWPLQSLIYCYIFRPPGKWFWTILHATSSLPARWTPLVERKPDSKESGIDKGPTELFAVSLLLAFLDGALAGDWERDMRFLARKRYQWKCSNNALWVWGVLLDKNWRDNDICHWLHPKQR